MTLAVENADHAPAYIRGELLTMVEALGDATAVTAGAVVGIVLNARFPEGVDLPLLGRTRASVPLAGGALASAVMARACGYQRTARAVGGVALGAALVSLGPRPPQRRAVAS